MATTKRKVSTASDPEQKAGGQFVANIVSQIGEKVARLRSAQGLSLQQLSDKCDVSPAAIHKIERSGMVPTITTLLKIGAALGVPTSYFVQDDVGDPEPVHFTSTTERALVYTSHKGLSLSAITGSYRQFRTAAAIARVIPGANSGRKLLKHPGEELVHVLGGEMQFTIGQHTYHLTVGDSLHFSGELPHSWVNPSKKPAELIWTVLRNAAA